MDSQRDTKLISLSMWDKKSIHIQNRGLIIQEEGKTSKIRWKERESLQYNTYMYLHVSWRAAKNITKIKNNRKNRKRNKT